MLSLNLSTLTREQFKKLDAERSCGPNLAVATITPKKKD